MGEPVIHVTPLFFATNTHFDSATTSITSWLQRSKTFALLIAFQTNGGACRRHTFVTFVYHCYFSFLPW